MVTQQIRKNFRLRTFAQDFPEQKRVLVRVDFNVPVDSDGKILDTRRITNHRETLQFLKRKKAQIILLAHLGKPDGKVDTQLSFQKLLPQISELLKEDIQLQSLENYTPRTGITLLENIRFYPGEEKNDPVFAQRLASLADLYVNDAFSVSHRSHASIVGIIEHLPSFAGFALEREVKSLSTVFTSPPRPVTVLIGGKKVSDKIGVIKHLLPKVDHILIGGACATTFAAAQGTDMKQSFIEKEMFATCLDLLSHVQVNKIHLPIDFVEADNAYLDIGPKTISNFSKVIQASKVVVWAGPMGKYEDLRFNKGNEAILKAIVATKAKSIIGGGDTLAASQSFPEFEQVSFVSLGGGAMLEFLEKETLPGIEALMENAE